VLLVVVVVKSEKSQDLRRIKNLRDIPASEKVKKNEVFSRVAECGT
jgi:hypothetical protein